MFQLGNKIHTEQPKQEREKKSIMLSTEFIHHHRFARKSVRVVHIWSFFSGTTRKKNPSFVFSASLLLRVVYCTVVRVDTLPRQCDDIKSPSRGFEHHKKYARRFLISLEIFFSISHKV